MPVDPVLASAIHHLTVAKQYVVASWVLALYEYLITFDREVQSIWKRKFSVATVLWVLNRYTLLLSYFPITLSFFVPLTTEFPGTIQIISNISTGVTLSLRVYALYGRAWWLIPIIVPFLIVEIAIESWAVASGIPVPIPDGQTGCILTGRPTQGDRFAAFWIGQLVFPSMIFVLTVARILLLHRQGTARGGISVLMLRDGVMYFIVIFIVNFANVLTYVVSPPDIQAINAPFSALITAVMICRLMLNLRAVSGTTPGNSAPYVRTRERMGISETLIGNLGEELDIGNVDNREYYKSQSRMGAVREETSYELSTLPSFSEISP
ncbi:hypothetical protein M0805_001465 [Coniferiporia weirii]|nr:hypothetical protein M0805_001465 [Coniferiporia weirii]